MNRDLALSILRNLRPSLERRGVAHAGVFGSVARGDARPTSDVDVVVTPGSGRRFDLFELGGIQELLEIGFKGVRVDLVAEPVGSPGLRNAVLRDRINAF
jgi:predicted nucleotidyltransferase